MKTLFSMFMCVLLLLCASRADAGYYPDCTSEDWQMGTCFGYAEALQAQAQTKAEAEAIYGEAAISAGVSGHTYWANGSWHFGVLVTVTFGGGGGYQCNVVWDISSATGLLSYSFAQCYGIEYW